MTIIQADRADWLGMTKWFADSGHEWLQVPLWAAKQADQADRERGGDGISVFSYVKGVFAYLEGDCDAAIFFDTFKVSDSERSIIQANGVALYSNLAPVRNYARWGA